jgi:hypothetical protein
MYQRAKRTFSIHSFQYGSKKRTLSGGAIQSIAAKVHHENERQRHGRHGQRIVINLDGSCCRSRRQMASPSGKRRCCIGMCPQRCGPVDQPPPPPPFCVRWVGHHHHGLIVRHCFRQRPQRKLFVNCGQLCPTLPWTFFSLSKHTHTARASIVLSRYSAGGLGARFCAPTPIGV